MKDKILNQYENQGIISIGSLYEFILNNNYVSLDGKKYNLEVSNEVVEFMAGYFEAKNYKIKRLFFQTSSNKYKYHFAVAFNIANKWYYYETLIQQLKGKYIFDDFTTLVNFIYSNMCNIYTKGTLKIINNPISTNIDEAIKESEKGEEVFASDRLLLPKAYRQVEEYEEIEPRKSSIKANIRYKYALITVSFAVTLALLVGILYLLYSMNKWL